MGEFVDMICESEEEQGDRKLFMMSMTKEGFGDNNKNVFMESVMRKDDQCTAPFPLTASCQVESCA